MNAYVRRPSTDSRTLHQIGQDVYRAESGRTVAHLCSKPFGEGRTGASVAGYCSRATDQANATEADYVPNELSPAKYTPVRSSAFVRQRMKNISMDSFARWGPLASATSTRTRLLPPETKVQQRPRQQRRRRNELGSDAAPCPCSLPPFLVAGLGHDC
jgi:hypothetical protein